MTGFFNSPFIFLGAFLLFLAISIGVVLILWIAMPFSIFGTKNLLKKLIEEQEKANKLLKSIDERLQKENIYKESGEFAEKRDDLH
ncbi:MAG: hypothetical protein HY954_11425 [Deltaproteobacteria bacterium]|nr:hypothetical protein [Deltaproteobacteria bacterium]